MRSPNTETKRCHSRRNAFHIYQQETDETSRWKTTPFYPSPSCSPALCGGNTPTPMLLLEVATYHVLHPTDVISFLMTACIQRPKMRTRLQVAGLRNRQVRKCSAPVCFFFFFFSSFLKQRIGRCLRVDMDTVRNSRVEPP